MKPSKIVQGKIETCDGCGKALISRPDLPGVALMCPDFFTESDQDNPIFHDMILAKGYELRQDFAEMLREGENDE